MLAGPPLVDGCGWRLAAGMLVLETHWLSCDLRSCVLGYWCVGGEGRLWLFALGRAGERAAVALLLLLGYRLLSFLFFGLWPCNFQLIYLC